MMNATGATHCLICHQPRASLPGISPWLCASRHCAEQLRAMPAHQKCRTCQQPLPRERWVTGRCAQLACAMAQVAGLPAQIDRTRTQELITEARRRRDRAAAQLGIPAGERESYLVAVVPRNTDRASRLPAERREAFLAHLRRSLAEARARLARGDTPMPATIVRARENGRTPEEQQAEFELLGAGCAVCRGNCCRQGGDHAFNTSDTMMHWLLAHPTDTDEAIVARYAALLPARSLTHGCVFQQATGCALPRAMRSDVCNRFFCEYISVLRNQFGPGDPVRAYYTHQRSALYGGTFVQIRGRTLPDRGAPDRGAPDRGTPA